jgi:hypothetical protein
MMVYTPMQRLSAFRRSDSRCRLLVVALTLMLLLSSSTSGAQQLSAKSLFYGTPAGNANPYGPVGFHYWFEDATTPLRWNEVGARIVSPGTRAAGTALRLHIVLNTPAYLGIWLAKGTADARGVVLTPSEGRYVSFFFQANREYIMGGEILIPPAGADASVIILMSRAQSENAGSAASAREKIRVVSARPTPDGSPAIVQETDATTPSESGVYVVHRRGLQPGIEIPLGATRN